jgi:uracil-DNA glycosylase
MDALTLQIKQCNHCRQHLPMGPRPVVQLSATSRIVIIGQAPGRRVHETGIPWNDASGKKLRQWLNVDEDTFYDPALFSILPMGFCYPGKGSSGDLAPRHECAPLWHHAVFSRFIEQPLVLLIGQYAQRYYLKKEFNGLTDTVKKFERFLPNYFPLPHPSPRNQYWLKINRWFMNEVVVRLRSEVERKVSAEQ